MLKPECIQPVTLEKSWRILNHGPTVWVASAHGGKQNVMAAAWCMPLDYHPPRLVVIIDKNSLTSALVAASGEFVIAVPAADQAQLTLQIGNSSGRDTDKFVRYGIDAFAAQKVTAPLPAGCLAWLECRVVCEPHVQQTYDMVIGEIVAASADSAVYSKDRWHFPDKERTSVHYVSGGFFFRTGEGFVVENEA